MSDLAGDPIVLEPADDHHLRRVLRVRAGEFVSVSDGAGAWRWCEAGPDAVLHPASEIAVEPAPAPITVAFALVKGDRPEWIVQKLTELGVDRIVPFESARTVVRWRGGKEAHHIARLQRVAREAAMQSRRVHLPQILTVRAAAEILSEPEMCIAEPGGEVPTSGITALAVGPEGGFTDDELALSQRRVSLPGGVLRTETAAITAGVVLATRRSAS